MHRGQMNPSHSAITAEAAPEGGGKPTLPYERVQCVEWRLEGNDYMIKYRKLWPGVIAMSPCSSGR